MDFGDGLDDGYCCCCISGNFCEGIGIDGGTL